MISALFAALLSAVSSALNFGLPGAAASPEALVQALGSRALWLYAALLLGLLLLTGGLWWLSRRWHVAARTNEAAGLPSKTTFAPRFHGASARLVWMAVGFAVVVGAAAAFAELAQWLGDPVTARQTGALDQLFSNAVRASISPGVFRLFAAITHLADTATLVVLCLAVTALLVLKRQRLLALGWALAIGGNALLNTTLKGVFARARPVHEPVAGQPWEPVWAGGFSFPSGHSSGAVVAYGMLAYLLLRAWPPAKTHGGVSLAVVWAAAALALTIGCSRVAIQVHFATDVLAGFASGSAWLVVCIASLQWAQQRAPAA